MNEAELLFTNLLSCSRTQLYINRKESLGRDKSIFVSNVLKRRIKGEPIQYILGKADFMGLEFYVNPDVLIPRPETELLVEKVMEFEATNILEIGTGSGCIAIILAKLLKNTKVIATDISKKALLIAEKNAKMHKVDDRIEFMHSDLFKNSGLRASDFELIISNPPYVPSAQIETLQREVQFEPRLALDGGRDGLDYIKRIISESPRFLKSGGLLMTEIGFRQAEKIKNIFGLRKDFNIMEIIKDYNQIERVVVAKKR